jgi:hypothetical protein
MRTREQHIQNLVDTVSMIGIFVVIPAMCLFFFLAAYHSTWILYIIGGLVALAWIIGAVLPGRYTLTRAAEFHQLSVHLIGSTAPTPEAIWQTIADYESSPTWPRHLRGLTICPPVDGRATWKEKFGGDKPSKWLTLQLDEFIPNQRLVTRFANPNSRTEGTWTYEISATPTGSRLRITERGKVFGAFNSFMVCLVFREPGHPVMMTNYLLDLGRQFGQEVKVVER